MIKKLQRKFIISAMAAVTIVLSIIMIIVNSVNYVNIIKSANNLLNILEDNNGVFPMEEKDNPPAEDNGEKKPPQMDISKEAPFQTRYFTVEITPEGNVYRIDTGKIAAISTETAKEYALELYNQNKTEGRRDCYIYRAVNLKKATADSSNNTTKVSGDSSNNTTKVSEDSSNNATKASGDSDTNVEKNSAASGTNAEKNSAASDTNAEKNSVAGSTNATEINMDSIAQQNIANSSQNGNTMYIFLNVENDLKNFYTFLWSSIAVSIIGIVFVLILIVVFSKRIVSPMAQSYEKQKIFITDASHEIKTPLAVIEANTEVVEIENGESQWTKSIKEQISRLSELTEKLVFLAKMDEERNTFVMTEFSLSKLAQEVTEGFNGMAKAQNKKYTVSIASDISIKADEKAIKQLLSILIENAFKYSDKEGNIAVTVKKNGKYKEIEVRNTADNLKKGDLSILFERFYRLDSSRNSNTGGSGIGLSIAKAIVEAHKGKIKAYSLDGKEIVLKVSMDI